MGGGGGSVVGAGSEGGRQAALEGEVAMGRAAGPLESQGRRGWWAQGIRVTGICGDLELLRAVVQARKSCVCRRRRAVLGGSGEHLLRQRGLRWCWVGRVMAGAAAIERGRASRSSFTVETSNGRHAPRLQPALPVLALRRPQKPHPRLPVWARAQAWRTWPATLLSCPPRPRAGRRRCPLSHPARCRSIKHITSSLAYPAAACPNKPSAVSPALLPARRSVCAVTETDAACFRLDGIVERLTTAEWRELLARLSQRDFRCDIVGASPVELVEHIFRFLPPHAPFLYQRVSRQWQRLLSSSHVTGCALDSWYAEGDRKLAGEAAGLYGDRLTVQKWKADHVKRFREGRPYHGTFYYGSWNVKLTAPDRGEFPEADFVQDTLAWKALRRIEAFNFRTGEHHSIMTDAREQIGTMKLTENLVAFFTLFSRVCHIYDLQTKERTHFTLHNQNLDVFAAQGRTVLVASESRNPTWSTRLNIHLWNAVERRTRSFEINRVRLVDEGRPYQYMPKSVVIDERTRSVVWFFCLRKETKNWLSFERWSFEGVLLGRYEHNDCVSVYSLRTAEIRPMDYEGRLYHIKTPVRPFGYREEPVFARTMTTIVFDNKLNQISIKTSNDGLPAFRNEYFRKMPFDKFTVCLWKDGMFYMPPAVTDEEARTKDSTWGPQTYQTLERRGLHLGIMDIPEDMAVDHSGMPGDENLLGNEHLLVLLRRGHCAVWCFDPHLQLPERIPVDDPL